MTLRLLLLVAITALTNTVSGQATSILESNSQPVLLDNGPVVAQETVLDEPIVTSPVHSAAPELTLPSSEPSYYRGPAVVQNPLILHSQAPAQVVTTKICTTCKCTVCCCKTKAKIATTFDLVDPAGCVHRACVRVPACCSNEAPIVTWKGKLFGRQVATLCWDCCDFNAKVVVTRRGKIRVRD